MIQNVLLVNPWIYDFAAYDFWNKPIGLLLLASFLRKNGLNVHYVDCLDHHHPELRGKASSPRTPKRKNTGSGAYLKTQIPTPEALRFFPRRYNRYGIDPADFLRIIQALPRPDIVMITSMMTYWYPAVFDTISLVRQTFPGIPVVLGGNYVSLCPQHAASKSKADYCLEGPAERSMPFLFKDVMNRELYFHPDPSDLDSLPYPAFDLIDHPDQVPILTSRGCPYRCSYCASPLLNGQFRRRDPIHVAEEIEFWHSHLGIRNFSFYDDALLVNPEEMAIPLFHELIKRDLPVQFHCPNGLHLREITPEISRLMFEAGFRTIRFGFESSDRGFQRTTGGKVDNREFADAVSHLRHAGYKTPDIGVYLLCGVPGQDAEEVEASIRFVHSHGARPVIAEYSPIPGTALWADAVAASPYAIADEPLFHNNTLLPCRSGNLTYEMYQTLKRIAGDPGLDIPLSPSPPMPSSSGR